MNNSEMKQYMNDQIHEIEIHKWIESEKAKKDLGDDAVKDWIKSYAKQYRENWIKTHNINNNNK